MSLLTSLISYWKLDEASGTRFDSNGTNDLTDNNSVGSATGIINNGAAFVAASTQFLNVVSNSNLQGGDVDLTVTCWVKLTSKSSNQCVVGKRDALEYEIRYGNGSDNFNFFYGDAGGAVSASTFGSPSTGTWYFIVAWHDATAHTVNICVNDGPVDSVSDAGFGLNAHNGDFRIGSESGGNFLDGNVDEVGFWKRLLTSGERTSLYNGGAGLPYGSFAGGVQFDAVSNSGYQAAASTYSWSHVCSGTNRFLAVDISMLSAGQTVTGITYNGVALSLIGARTTVTSFGRIESWGLANPTSGSNTIAVTLSGSIASAGTAVSYTGVDQTTPTEAFNSNQATNVGAADATVTVTSITDNCWIHAAVATSDASITAGQTSRNNVTGAGGSGADEDTGPITPAGGTAMNYTGVGALATWAIGGYGIRPVQTVVVAFIPYDLAHTPQHQTMVAM